MRRAQRTHIDDIDILESRKGKVLENLTSKAASSTVKH